MVNFLQKSIFGPKEELWYSLGYGRPSKIKLLQSYEVLWIHWTELYITDVLFEILLFDREASLTRSWERLICCCCSWKKNLNSTKKWIFIGFIALSTEQRVHETFGIQSSTKLVEFTTCPQNSWNFQQKLLCCISIALLWHWKSDCIESFKKNAF